MSLKDTKNFAIFGLSFGGRQFIRKCIENNLKVDGILDNDRKKDGTKFCGVPIILPEKATEIGIKNIFLIGRYVEEQKKQLFQLGYSKNNMFNVPRKDIALGGNSLLNRNKLTKIYLKTISEICVSLNIEMWLDASGLLLAARKQEFGVLSDFDLIIKGEQKASILLKELVSARPDWIVKNHLKTQNLNESEIIVMSSELEERLEPAVIDLRGPMSNPWFKKNPSLINRHFTNSSKYLEKTNIKYPNEYEEYLGILYGPDWKTPKDFYTPNY